MKPNVQPDKTNGVFVPLGYKIGKSGTIAEQDGETIKKGCDGNPQPLDFTGRGERI
ncbi:MAG: hypothetical protein N2317_00010 [Syntrophales bacterium]|nr:hypothetical protein [Syntrophales bacterium]